MRHISSAPPRPGLGRPRKRPRQAPIVDPERLNGCTHFLARRQLRECVVCSSPTSGERHRTRYYCKTCSSQPSLCPDTCFESYHSQEHYRSFLTHSPQSGKPHALTFMSLYILLVSTSSNYPSTYEVALWILGPCQI